MITNINIGGHTMKIMDYLRFWGAREDDHQQEQEHPPVKTIPIEVTLDRMRAKGHLIEDASWGDDDGRN